ncbi:MAG: DUF58 domain-containing protein [Planctomycetota bacterium]
MSLLRVLKSSDKSKSTKEIDVFPEEFIKKLEKLRFVVKKILFSGTVGEQIMSRRGGRLEFTGHRDYTHGDETRYIDWNAFARLERLYIKEFAQEKSVPLYILLDISASMLSTNIQIPARLPARKTSSGGDVISKIDYAKQLVAVLGYIGLIIGQPVHLFAFSHNSFHTSGIFKSDKQLFEMMAFLRKLEPIGQTNIYDACIRFDKIINKKGFFILLSDLFENIPARLSVRTDVHPGGDTRSGGGDDSHAPLERTIIKDKDDDSYPERSEGSQRDSSLSLQNDCGQLSNGLGSPEILLLHRILERLNNKGFIINIMHIFSDFDEAPSLNGLYRLRDSESGEEKVIRIDNKTISKYRHIFSSFSEGWNSFCLKHNIKYFHLNTRTPLEDVVFRLLRQRKLLR